MAKFNFGRADYNEMFGGSTDEDAEPVFLLRGKDMAAPVAVRKWVSAAKDYGADTETLVSGNTQAQAMQRYAEASERQPADLERSAPGAG